MRKFKLNLFRNIFAIIVMIASFTAIVFAAFNVTFEGNVEGSSDDIAAEIDFTALGSSGSCFDLGGNACSNLFSAPGNTYEFEIEVKNTQANNRPLSYDLSFIFEDEDNLKNAVLVYLDDVFYGTLGELSANPTFRTPTLGYLLNNQTKTHNLRFEYHSGSTLVYNNQKVSLKVKANYRAVNKDLIALVSGFEDAVDSNNKITTYGIKNIADATIQGFNNHATVVLANNITVSEDLIFHKAVTIDTNGHTLTIASGKSITFKGEGVSAIKGSGTLSGTVIIDSEDGILLSKENITYQIVNYNQTLLIESYNDYFYNISNGGLYETVNFEDSYKPYNLNAIISSEYTSYITANNTSKTLTPTQSADSYAASLNIKATINGSSVTLFDGSINVWGNQTTTYLNNLINNELYYLVNNPTIGHDIFLPNKFKSVSTSSISWYSSDNQVISESGRYTKPIVDGEVTLSALITLHNKIHVVDFDLSIVGMTYPEKVKLIVGSYGDIFFDTLNETANLPTVSNYLDYSEGIDLGITNISYSYDITEYPFLTLTGSQLQIIDYTDVTYVPLRIGVTFGQAGTFYETITVSISLEDPSSAINYYVIYEYISNFFPHESVIKDFEVPSFFRTNITYWIPDAVVNGNAKDIVGASEITNSQVALNIIGGGYRFTNGVVEIDTNEVPAEDVLINVIVEVGVQRRLYTFTVAGVLHTSRSYMGKAPAYVQIPNTILFDEIVNDLFNENVERNANYIMIKSISDPTHRKATTLEVIKTTNAQDIDTIKGIEYFYFLTSVSIRVNIDGNGNKNPTDLNNNSFSDVTYMDSLVNLTNVQLVHASITTIASWTRLNKVVTLDLRGNPNLLYIHSIEKWSGQLATLDVRGNALINPSSASNSIHFYSFSKTSDLYKKVNGTNANPTLRYGSAVNATTTFNLASFIGSGTWGSVNAKTAVDRINGMPEVMYESLVLPLLYFDDVGGTGFLWQLLNPKVTRELTKTYWKVHTGTEYLSIANAGTEAAPIFKVTVNSLPSEDVMIVLIANLRTGGLGGLGGDFDISRSFFITLKGTG